MLSSMRMTFTSALVLAAGFLFAQNPADDPGGWLKAKWGMTQPRISEAFPGQTNMYNDWSRSKPALALGINGTVIASAHYDVRFFFDKDGGLSGVLIAPEGGVIGKA
jgi:hypothetical protein